MEVWAAVRATALTSWERIGRCNRRSHQRQQGLSFVFQKSEKVGATWWSLMEFEQIRLDDRSSPRTTENSWPY